MEEVKWYAMNAFRGGALNAQRSLTNSGIENFVPKEYSTSIVKGKRVKHQLKAVVPSLIFVKGTFAQLDEICNASRSLHFRYTKIYGGERNRPIIVPNDEMEQFIAFVDGNEEHLEYITEPDTLNFESGERVRVTEGPFAGREAIFVKIANVTKRQIVIKIEGVLGATVACKFPSKIVERV